MFKNKGNYPYPVLLEDNIDYKTSIIQAKYYYKGLKEGHQIRIECQIENDEIKKLIEENKAFYAVQIESPNAMYRQMFRFFDGSEMCITLKNSEVIDYIEIGVAIIANEDIENFQNKDFIEAYEDIKMKVNKNEILAVCESVTKVIALEDETLKEVHSIFNVQKDAEIDNITYDPNKDRILIRMPEDIANFYLKSKGSKERLIILNTMILTPILTGIVNDMKEGEEEFADKLWFKTLSNKIDEIIREKEITREEIFENAYETAQILLRNIVVDAIHEFQKLLEIQEGDED